jgi:biopolymer transport protein ExbD
MAFNMTNGGGRRSRGMSAMAEINVTPFVDVVLVLLIIFIITAHVMDYGIEVNVPKTKSVASSTKDLPVVLLSKDAELYLNSSKVKLVDLVAMIHARFPGQTDVYLRADGQTPYEQVAQVGAELGAAKFNLKLVTQPDSNASRH